MTYPTVKILSEPEPADHNPFIPKAIDAFPFLASAHHAVILHNKDTKHNKEIAEKALAIHAVNYNVIDASEERGVAVVDSHGHLTVPNGENSDQV